MGEWLPAKKMNYQFSWKDPEKRKPEEASGEHEEEWEGNDGRQQNAKNV